MKRLLILGLLIGVASTCLSQDLMADAGISSDSEPTVTILLDDPLFLVSSMKTARIVTKDEFEKINHHQIAYIQVITDPYSTVIYGEKAKNGVVLIVMKENSFSERYSPKRRRHK